jgi:hypothetical protein
MTTIEELNAMLRGWYNYFKHIKNSKKVFEDVDSYIRRSLRSILSAFEKKRGSHRKSNNYRWPNKYFHTRGLFSLFEKHKKNVALAKGNL